MLQKYLKILSIDGNLRKISSGIPYDDEKFLFTIEALFNGVPYRFDIQHVATEEYNNVHLMESPIFFHIDGEFVSLRSRYYGSVDFVKRNPEIDFLFASHTPTDLDEIIYDTVFSYFEKTNKFKLINTFH